MGEPPLIRCDLVGTALEPIRREVHWRQTTNYAAAVGDPNPRYLDDTRDGGLAVHPVFPVALSWPLIAGIAEQLSGLVPAEAFPRMVHADEFIAWHARLEPGDELTLSGRVAAVLPTPAGARVVLRIEARGRTGRAVFTEHVGGLFRGLPCDGAGAGADAIPALPELAVSAVPRWHCELAVSPLATFLYDGCSEIVFPIHTSEAFARFAGLPGIILQGTAGLAMAAGRLIDREAGGDPGRVLALGCSFRRPVRPGTRIRIEAFDLPGGELGFRVLDHQGAEALRQGFLALTPEA